MKTIVTSIIKTKTTKQCESSSKIKPAKPRISLVYGDVGSAVAPLKYQPIRPFNNVTEFLFFTDMFPNHDTEKKDTKRFNQSMIK